MRKIKNKRKSFNLETDCRKDAATGGFSLLELLIVMTITLVVLGLTATMFSGALATRSRESSRTDALTSAQAALNIISREIGNSGYGLNNNGIVAADSNNKKLHVRANVGNLDVLIQSPGEDLTYFYEPLTKSIARYDPNDNPKSSVVVNRISDVSFKYFSYTGSNSTPTPTSVPTKDTGRVQITVTVILEDVVGQPKNQTVSLTSDVTLRNSPYMLNQY